MADQDKPTSEERPLSGRCPVTINASCGSPASAVPESSGSALALARLSVRNEGYLEFGFVTAIVAPAVVGELVVRRPLLRGSLVRLVSLGYRPWLYSIASLVLLVWIGVGAQVK